jgi:hypothetical protein
MGVFDHVGWPFTLAREGMTQLTVAVHDVVNAPQKLTRVEVRDSQIRRQLAERTQQH